MRILEKRLINQSTESFLVIFDINDLERRYYPDRIVLCRIICPDDNLNYNMIGLVWSDYNYDAIVIKSNIDISKLRIFENGFIPLRNFAFLKVSNDKIKDFDQIKVDIRSSRKVDIMNINLLDQNYHNKLFPYLRDFESNYEHFKSIVNSKFSKNKIISYSIFKSEKLVGGINCIIYEKDEANILFKLNKKINYISSIYIDPLYRRNSLGSILLKYISHELNNRVEKLYLNFFPENSDGFKFWKFHEVNVIDYVYIKRVDNEKYT